MNDLSLPGAHRLDIVSWRLIMISTCVAILGGCQRDLEGLDCPCDEVVFTCCGGKVCLTFDHCPAQLPQLPQVQKHWIGLADSGLSVLSPLIDDLESGDGVIPDVDGRVGAWYTFNDGAGVQQPPPTPGTPIRPVGDPSNNSRFAMCSDYHYDKTVPTTGSGNAWGAGVGVDLQYDGQTYGHYDASFYDGISFRARASRPLLVQARVSTVETTSVLYGGSCNDGCLPFGTDVPVTDQWQPFRVSFASLGPNQDDRTPRQDMTLAKDQVTNIQFLFARPRLETTDYDIPPPSAFCVDDLAFWRAGYP